MEELVSKSANNIKRELELAKIEIFNSYCKSDDFMGYHNSSPISWE